MCKNVVLVLSNISKITASLLEAKNFYPKILYIHLRPQIAKNLSSDVSGQSTNYSSIVSNIYAKSLEYSETWDVRVLLAHLKSKNYPKIVKPIDVLLFDSVLPLQEQNKIRENYKNAKDVIVIDKNGHDYEDIQDIEYLKQENLFNNVVLGGTFDRIHVGHKILLSEAVLYTRKRLVVGVTDANMIKSKKLPELILPVEKRIAHLREFLNDIDHSIEYDIVPIQDPFGPTKSDPNLDMIVVSEETYRGGEKVNELRLQNKLNKLEIHCIKLIEMDNNHEQKESKISSSNRRIDMLGIRIKEPEPRPNLPSYPYIIGLMGGIASGKTTMSERFQKLGAKVVDCDKLAHNIYEPGKKCFDDIKMHFGDSIIDENGRVNRKKLGSIVFQDRSKLEELNGIVWPHLLIEVRNVIRELSDYDVIILEAAILIRAGWQSECHEIWSCIVPRDEAIKRIMNRNKISQDEAIQRVDAQVDNETIVKNSNVIFSTLWSFDYSQMQVSKKLLFF